MPHTRLRASFTFTEKQLAQLRAIAPETFSDGRVNWAVFRETLGEQLEDEGQEVEQFGLFWPGKRTARRLAAMPSRGTLIPDAHEGVKQASTKNFVIEGDNLEVL